MALKESKQYGLYKYSFLCRHQVGWLEPVYSTAQYNDDGFHSKVAFGGSTFESGAEMGVSRQEAEQKAALSALIGLGCLDNGNKYSSDGKICLPFFFGIAY